MSVIRACTCGLKLMSSCNSCTSAMSTCALRSASSNSGSSRRGLEHSRLAMASKRSSPCSSWKLGPEKIEDKRRLRHRRLSGSGGSTVLIHVPVRFWGVLYQTPLRGGMGTSRPYKRINQNMYTTRPGSLYAERLNGLSCFQWR